MSNFFTNNLSKRFKTKKETTSKDSDIGKTEVKHQIKLTGYIANMKRSTEAFIKEFKYPLFKYGKNKEILSTSFVRNSSQKNSERARLKLYDHEINPKTDF